MPGGLGWLALFCAGLVVGQVPPASNPDPTRTETTGVSQAGAVPSRADTALDAVPELDAALSAIENASERSDYAEARRLAQALELRAREAQRPRYRAAALNELGRIARRLGELDQAIDFHEQARAIRESIADDRGAATSWGYLGTTYRDLGLYPEALEAQLKALALREKLPGERLDVSYRSLAQLYRELGELEEARSQFEKAEAAAQQLDRPDALATVRGTYAGLLNELGEHDAALAKARQALAVDEQRDPNYGAALERIEIGRALIGLDRLAEARHELDLAKASGERTGDVEVLGRALLHQGELEHRLRNFDAAIAVLQRAVAVFTRSQLKGQLSDALLHLQLAYAARGGQAEALDTANRRMALNAELFNVQASRRTARLEYVHQQELAQRRIEALERENRIAALELEGGTWARWFGLALIALLVTIVAFTISRNRALARLNEVIEAKSRELYESSIRDPLTGIYNRRHVMHELERTLADNRRDGARVSVLLIDFDHFKRINDSYGHQAGDEALRSGALMIRGLLGEQGLLGRYGGEELIALLPDSDRGAVRRIAEAICTNVREQLRPVLLRGTQVTISVGIATLADCESRNTAELIRHADEALYAAKAGGRNRAMAHVAAGAVA